MAGKGCYYQADAKQTTGIPYIPPEVHRIIARYIHSSDLPNYRLVSKTLAEIGAEELFSTVTFHCSSASIARVESIKGCQHLNKHVRNMVWDTNFWKISNVQDLDDWRRYFRGRAFATRWYEYADQSMPAERFDGLERDKEEWGRYLVNMGDEKKAKNYRTLQTTFTGFHNFTKLHILNGDLVTGYRGVNRLSDHCRVPELTSKFWRGEGLYNDRPPTYSLERPCGHALAAMQYFRGISWCLTKLRLNAVCGKVFHNFADGIESLQNLSSLHLRLTVLSRPLWGRYVINYPGFYDITLGYREEFHSHHLMRFLVKLPELQSLKLDFYGRFRNQSNSGDAAPATLNDIFAVNHSWSKLRKLSLRHLDTTPEAFLSLLERHQSTLEVLKLHAMMLHPDQSEHLNHIVDEQSWPQVFDRMKGVLSLKHATFSGHFSFKDETSSACSFENKSTALAAASYMVSGGEFPFCKSHKGANGQTRTGRWQQ